MRHEVSGQRPSALSAVFRRYAAPGQPLADWTRHVDGDWMWYCPTCGCVVLLIEEKTQNALQRSWAITRRLATRHEDRPWGWRVTATANGFAVVGARNASGHDAFAVHDVSEGMLIDWIVWVFTEYYREAGHPQRTA